MDLKPGVVYSRGHQMKVVPWKIGDASVTVIMALVRLARLGGVTATVRLVQIGCVCETSARRENEHAAFGTNANAPPNEDERGVGYQFWPPSHHRA
jgi:hypothetical protein